MADSANIITWQNVDVTPVDDALIYETAIGAGGVIYGCEVTLKNSNTMHIAAGHAIVCGRKMTIVESDLAIPLSTGGTQLGRLYLQLDLSNTAAPAQMLTEVGGSLTPPTQNENVNIFNGTYEINLYTFNVSPTTIADLVRVANPLANILGNFAPIETKLAASQEYLEGACLIKDNQLYEALGDINPGDRLAVGGNIIKTSVEEQIASIKSDLAISTDGIWTVRKGKNIAECWGEYNMASGTFSPDGAIFYRSSGNIPFPVGLFSSSPIVSITAVYGNIGAVTLSGCSLAGITAIVMSATSTAREVRLQIRAIGKTS